LWYAKIELDKKVMDTLWLGYDGLTVPYGKVVAILVYMVTLDRLVERSYGSVPQGVQSVVLTNEGKYLPARWTPQQLRHRWANWRNTP
jgi:hypothetical protein